jgi:hypothetical protein
MVTNPSSETFIRKISSFSEMRLAPLLAEDDLRRLTSFMLHLVRSQSYPPMQGEKVDWSGVGFACGLRCVPTAKVRRVGQHGFDAIVRWLIDKLGEENPGAREAKGYPDRAPKDERPPRPKAAASTTPRYKGENAAQSRNRSRQDRSRCLKLKMIRSLSKRRWTFK